MARKTVRIDVPTNSPDDLIVLGKKVLLKHTASGAVSPLDTAKMAKLQTAVTSADGNNNTAKDLDGEAQRLRQLRDTSLGVSIGQTVETRDTVLNLVTYARNQLLIANDGNEEALSGYGFNVVVGTAKNPAKKPS